MPVKKATPKKSSAKKAAPAAKKVNRPDLKDFLHEVEKRAYDLYQERTKSGVSGDEMADWFAAEKEIKEKYKL